MKLVRPFALLLLLPSATSSHAQQKISFFPVKTGKTTTTLFAYQATGTGGEIWYYGNNGDLEVISSKLAHAGKQYHVTLGGYLRYRDVTSKVDRVGISGTLSFGAPTGLQLVGPYYMFREQSGGNQRIGLWAPNLRLNYPVTKQLRAGIGLGYTQIQGSPTKQVVGVHFQLKRGSEFYQLRVGKTQNGVSQLWTGVTHSL
jgi:hypothetical protein